MSLLPSMHDKKDNDEINLPKFSLTDFSSATLVQIWKADDFTTSFDG
jgi:hypothetical protein